MENANMGTTARKTGSTLRWLLLTALVVTALGCSSEKYAPEAAATITDSAAAAAAEAPGSGGGADSAKADLGVLLAYEHRVRVRLSGDQIAARAKAVQDACSGGKFGACAVLGMNQRGGDDPGASLQVRIVPQGVEPLIALAGQGDQIAERGIQAEDLAVAVRDNSMRQDRLRREHARLLEFQERRDLKMADVLTLSQRIAEIESQLQAAEQEAAQQQRRISTQLINFDFATTATQESTSEIGQALKEFGGIVASVIAFLIRAFAVLLPLGLVGGFCLWLLVKFMRARRARRKAAGG
ncbi:DUF4349 domain-containing protein [Lysobacter sp. K5869]|uniref:DUF4349 domain-containing protein n=1 Tax=Lysobacter sp. K5869 TaxID=2820808 RepID=UPI001C064977|nr:DUF4349 domain-containing protein [Lysobacter sp. K5869]QWP76331.1 DUF4349 domain-containing protein [Lysobacter sp. K5869]